MKTSLKISTLVLLFYIGSTQIALSQAVSFGPRVGLNIIPLGKDEVMGKTHATGINAGGFLNIPLGKNCSIGTGINISKKQKNYFTTDKSSLFKSLLGGLNIGGLNNLINDTLLNQIRGFINDTIYSRTRGTVTLNYVELPIMFQMQVKQFSFGAGGYFGYLYGAKSKEELTQTSALLDLVYPLIDSIPVIGAIVKGTINSSYPGYMKPDINESSDKGKYRSYDAGMMLDVTYTMSNSFTINARFTQGFVNYRNVALKKNDYNRTFMLCLGYSFGNKSSKGPKAKYDLDKKPADEK